jgi:tetratricopeptide (TPR) repeat protein
MGEEQAMANSIADLLRDGNSQLRRGEFVEASNTFQIVIDIDAFNTAALLGMARALAGQKRYQQAIWKAKAATKASPDSLEGYLITGELFTNMGNYQESLTWFQHACRVNEKSADAWEGAASALEKLGHTTQALEHYRKASELAPFLISARLRKAALLEDLQYSDEAINAYKELIELENYQPRHIDDSTAIRVRMRIAATLLSDRQYKAAYMRAKEGLNLISALNKNPSLADYGESFKASMHFYIGVSALGMKLYDQALQSLEAVEGSNQLSIKLLAGDLRASTYAQIGRYKDAWATVDALLNRHRQISDKNDKLDPTVAVVLGRLHTYRNQYQDAERIYRRAPDDDLSVLMQLAASLLARSDEGVEEAYRWRAEGRETFVRILSLLDIPDEGHSDKANAEKHAALGYLFTALGDADSAKVHLNRAKELDSADATTYANLAVIYRREGDLQKALQLYNVADSIGIDDATYKVAIAEIHLSMKMYSRAEIEFTEILSAAPGLMAARMGLGDTFYAQAEDGETDRCVAAIDQYSRALKDMLNGASSNSRSRTAESRILYARGCAHVQAYNYSFTLRGSGSRFGLKLRSSLTAAERDFRSAKRLGHVGADRALQIVAERGSSLRAREYPSIIITVVSIMLLVLVQVVFFGGYFTKLTPTQYETFSLALLAFTIAGLSLPQLLKLKVAGISIEKTASETQLSSLKVRADTSQWSTLHGHQSTVPRVTPGDIGEPTADAGKSGPTKDARRGAGDSSADSRSDPLNDV